MTSQEIVSDGSLVGWTLTLEFFSRSEITLKFDGVAIAPGAGVWNWSGPTGSTLVFSPAIANGVTVQASRVTDATAMHHNFEDGAQFLTRTLDDNFLQLLRLAQEYQSSLGGDPAELFDARYLGVRAVDPLVNSAGGPLSQGDLYSNTVDGSLRVYIGTAWVNPTALTPVILAANTGAALVGVNDGAAGSIFTTLAGFITKLLSSTGAAIVGFLQFGTGVVVRTVQAKLRDVVDVRDFGALNNGLQASAGVNRTAMQYAIDAMNARGGGTVNVGGGGVYYVDLTTYYRDSAAVYGVTSLKLLDNVAFRIEAGTTIRLIDGAYGAGAYYRMFSSRDATRLSNASICGGGTIDGNMANQIVNIDDNASNIQLECANNVRVEGIRSINAKGMGIQLRGAVGSNAYNLFVTNNSVENVKNIGIQVAWFSGLVISGNNVANCVNNGIDIYGEDGSVNCQAKHFTVTGNTVDTALTGVFCETVRNGTVSGNSFVQCAIGAIVNRINGQPRGIIISGNSFLTCPTAVRITGDTGGISVEGNMITDFSTSGVQLAAGVGGNVSYVSVTGNTFVPVNNTTVCVAVQGAVASFNSVRDNTVVSSGITAAYLKADTATSSVGNAYGGFSVLPAQVGPVLNDTTYGTFVPTLYGSTTAGTQTYTTRIGTYTKIGRMVFFKISIALSAKDAATAGNLRISGLPFVSENVAGALSGVTCTSWQFVTLTAGYTNVVGNVPGGATYVGIEQCGSAQVGSPVAAAAFAATSTFYFTGSYNI